MTIQHAMNLLGFPAVRTRSKVWLMPGRQITKIDWRGCMADDRYVEKVGRIVFCWGKSVYIKYPDEPLDIEHTARIRLIGRFFPSIEVWS